MKILVTSDLHYDIARSRGPAEDLARRVLHEGGDALVLVGDSAGADLQYLRQCLELFAAFPGRKFLVPGNHCLWCQGEENSLQRYHQAVPQTAQACGFSVLDHEPAVLGAAGLVGSIGWYDYSMQDPSLGLPGAFYEAKIAPGAAAYYQEFNWLVAAHRAELTERHLAMGARWMDGAHVRLGMSDAEFLQTLVDKLRRQLRQVEPQVETIAAFIHHLPFRELAPREAPPRAAFAMAFMGSPLLGEALLECPKVRHVYCGHSHWAHRRTIGQAQVVAIGSTYTDKRLEVLEL